jgi:hypothetical protein
MISVFLLDHAISRPCLKTDKQRAGKADFSFMFQISADGATIFFVFYMAFGQAVLESCFWSNK